MMEFASVGPGAKYSERLIRWFEEGVKPYLVEEVSSDETSSHHSIKLDQIYTLYNLAKQNYIDTCRITDFVTKVEEINEISDIISNPKSYSKYKKELFQPYYHKIVSVYNLMERGEPRFIDFDLLIKRSLYYAHREHYTYDICAYGHELDINCQEIWDSDYVLATDFVYNDYPGRRKTEIHTHEDAIARMNRAFPIVKYMSFDNYVIAGGAALYAVRSYGDDDQVDYDGDLDIFIFGSDPEKTYKNILEEIRDISSETKSSVTIRQDHCTTIFLAAAALEDNEIEAMVQRFMKIQIIHARYETPIAILKSFDLAPCRVLFNGETFLSDLSGLTAIWTNMIPLDMSNVGVNIPERVRRYCVSKDFMLLLLGVSRKKIFGCPLDADEATIEDKTFDRFRFGMARNEDLKEDAKILDNHFYLSLKEPVASLNEDLLDYSGEAVGFPEHIDEVAKSNVQIILKGGQPVFASENISEFIKGCVTVPLRYATFEDECSHILVSNFKRCFGDSLAREAWIAYFDDTDDSAEPEFESKFAKICKKRFEGLQKICNSQTRDIVWREIDPYRSNPSLHPYTDRFDPRAFYGQMYNGFTITADWPAKMTIIRAYKNKREEPGCLLVQILCKDIIKMIFRLVDDLTYEGSNLFEDEEEEEVPDPEDAR